MGGEPGRGFGILFYVEEVAREPLELSSSAIIPLLKTARPNEPSVRTGRDFYACVCSTLFNQSGLLQHCTYKLQACVTGYSKCIIAGINIMIVSALTSRNYEITSYVLHLYR
jgi:hypothetical protein